MTKIKGPVFSKNLVKIEYFTIYHQGLGNSTHV